MEIRQQYPLKSHHTFNIDVDGKYFAEVASVDEIREAIKFAHEREAPLLVLGGGSNVLFTTDFTGMVMQVSIKGRKVVKETDEHIFVKAGAGENWDEFVRYCVDRGYAGLENLSLIPGNVGASPIQNIGAYGVELKDHFESLEFYHFEQNEIVQFQLEDCRFGYRNSIFKQELKDKGVILSVTLRLNKVPVFKTEYGSIRDELAQMRIKDTTLKALRQAVINIRESKLPDPKITGNAGSFFKNPEVSQEQFIHLKTSYPDVVGYPVDDGKIKLAAGWLIDRCGWKGFRSGDCGVHEKQALVLVNFGEASGRQVYDLSEKIKQSVMDKFGVALEREVNIIG